MKKSTFRDLVFRFGIVLGIFVVVTMVLSYCLHLSLTSNFARAIVDAKEFAAREFSQNSNEFLLLRSKSLLLFALVLSYITTFFIVWGMQILLASRRKSRKLRAGMQQFELNLLDHEKHATLHAKREAESLHHSMMINAIFDETPEKISAIDREFRIMYLNDAYRRDVGMLLGVPIEVGVNIIDAHQAFPNGQVLAKEFWSRALDGEKFSTKEEFYENGGVRFFEVTYGPIRDKQGNIFGASNVVRDVTERVKAEQALIREHDFISNVVETSNLLVMVLDLEGKIIGFNKACEVASGYRFHEVKGRTYWNILTPTEEAAATKNYYRKFEADSPVRSLLTHWVTKREDRRLITWRNSLISDGDRGNQIIATGIDITEKEEFRETQSRVLEILESSSDFIGICDMLGEVHYANPAAKEILGITTMQISTSVQIESAFTDAAIDLIQTEGIPTALKRGAWMGETEIRTPSGREFPVSHLILAHRNERGEVEFLSSIARDISTQKRLETDILRARDAAIETARIKSEFLANMSHEIRTPMNGIIGLSELLLSTELDKEQRDYVESVQRSGEILLTIVNDILDFSKIEAGKLHMETVGFNLRTALESILDLFSEPAQRKDIEIGLMVHNNVPDTLYGDPRRLRQVLTNLIANALKFTESGEIMITVALDELCPESDRVQLRFSVADTGIGIDGTVQKQLFDPFTQADSSIQRKYGGTGLGLAISKQIVEMMDGEIGIESKVGRGSTFWFTSSFESSGCELYSDLYMEELRNRRILVVESNTAIRNMLLQQTKWLGIYADEASSAESALMRIEKAAKDGDPFDIVVIDSILSDLSGYEASMRIRRDKRFRNTRILLLSTINEQREVLRADEIGIDSFIFKPIKLTEFYGRLSDLSSDRKVQPQPLLTSFDENPIAEIRNVIVENDVQKFPSLDATSSIRILVAEDNLVNQKVISNQIANLGYRVDIAENGVEVLEKIKEREYSIILMDCEMPIMDGITATEHIRNAETPEKRIPIVAVTAHALEGDRERCLKSGMDDYLTKPTKQKELKSVINRWLNLDSTSGETCQPTSSEASETASVAARLNDLAESCGDDVTFECIGLFQEDFQMAIERLSVAVGCTDLETVGTEAHKLKGSTSNMGAVMLPRLSEQIMLAAREGDSNKVQYLFAEMAIERERLLPIIEKQRLRLSNKLRKLQAAK